MASAAGDLSRLAAAIDDPQPIVLAVVGGLLAVAFVWNCLALYWLTVLEPFLVRHHEPPPSESSDLDATSTRPGLDLLRALAAPPPPEPQAGRDAGRDDPARRTRRRPASRQPR